MKGLSFYESDFQVIEKRKLSTLFEEPENTRNLQEDSFLICKRQKDKTPVVGALSEENLKIKWLQ